MIWYELMVHFKVRQNTPQIQLAFFGFPFYSHVRNWLEVTGGFDKLLGVLGVMLGPSMFKALKLKKARKIWWTTQPNRCWRQPFVALQVVVYVQFSCLMVVFFFCFCVLLLVVGCWLLVVGCWLLVVGCLLFVVCLVVVVVVIVLLV